MSLQALLLAMALGAAPFDAAKVDQRVDDLVAGTADGEALRLGEATVERTTQGPLQRVHATVQEGGFVRDESYYFDQDKLFAVDVVAFWDVDDEAKAPFPPRHRRYYLGRTCRWRKVALEERSRKTASCKAALAKKLTARARKVRALVDGAPGAGAGDEAFGDWPEKL